MDHRRELAENWPRHEIRCIPGKDALWLGRGRTSRVVEAAFPCVRHIKRSSLQLRQAKSFSSRVRDTVMLQSTPCRVN